MVLGLAMLVAACSVVTWAGQNRLTSPPRVVTPLAALPGMPAATDRHNVYAAAGGMPSAAPAQGKALVYVPHSKSGDVWVIDPSSFQVIATYPAGTELQHVVPSYELRILYATDDRGNALLSFDPTTGKPGAKTSVVDPYNLFFTPDGAFAISVAERLQTLVWYDHEDVAAAGSDAGPRLRGYQSCRLHC